MKKFQAILFLSTYLLFATELNQLLKTPLLIEHFITHEKENPKLSFIGFLKMHYFNGNPRDSDYDQDMRLPFKSHNTCVNLISLNPSFQDTGDYLIKLYSRKIKLYYLPEVNYSSTFLESIWQPPKNS